MILLLDAHALVWWFTDASSLSAAARSAIVDPGNEVLVSAASIWELAIKRAKGKIDLADDMAASVDQAGFAGLPITLADAQAAAALPRHHDDPFDRMLIAQAIRLEAPVVTRDPMFARYDVEVLVA
jgi:PIN domain nuclease of toxin-antitoxin system